MIRLIKLHRSSDGKEIRLNPELIDIVEPLQLPVPDDAPSDVTEVWGASIALSTGYHVQVTETVDDVNKRVG